VEILFCFKMIIISHIRDSFLFHGGCHKISIKENGLVFALFVCLIMCKHITALKLVDISKP